MNNAPKDFRRVFGRFLAKKNTSLGQKTEHADRGVCLPSFGRKVEVLRIRLIFYILLLHIIELKPAENLPMRFRRVSARGAAA